MKYFWFSSLALIISLNSSEVLPGRIGGGSLPSAVRGRLWAIIQRRQRFCARTASSPFQNSRAISGVRISSPGCSTRCVSSWPATIRRPRSASRANVAAHWPGQPTARNSPPPGITRL